MTNPVNSSDNNEQTATSVNATTKKGAKIDLALGICLGSVAAVAPMATDIYIAAMPVMGKSLSAANGQIELTITAFFVGLCIGQLVFGPVSDRMGRKPVVLGGLIVFTLAALTCAFVQTPGALIFTRLIHGIGGSVGLIIAMAAVRDLYTGVKAAKLMGLVIAVQGIAPVIAPVIGGLILEWAGWRSIFIFQAIFAAFVILLVLFSMPETRSAELRAKSRPSQALREYLNLLKDRSFVPFAATSALTVAGFFVYLSGISIIVIEYYGLTPMQFSGYFAVNAIALTMTAQISGWAIARFGAVRTVLWVTWARAGIIVLLLGLALTDLMNFTIFVSLVFPFIASFGLVMPGCNMLAMDKQHAHAGTAAALIGALGFGAGALASGLFGFLADGTPYYMLLIMAVTAVFAAILAQMFFPANNIGDSSKV